MNEKNLTRHSTKLTKLNIWIISYYSLSFLISLTYVQNTDAISINFHSSCQYWVQWIELNTLASEHLARTETSKRVFLTILWKNLVNARMHTYFRRTLTIHVWSRQILIGTSQIPPSITIFQRLKRWDTRTWIELHQEVSTFSVRVKFTVDIGLKAAAIFTYRVDRCENVLSIAIEHQSGGKQVNKSTLKPNVSMEIIRTFIWIFSRIRFVEIHQKI